MNKRNQYVCLHDQRKYIKPYTQDKVLLTFIMLGHRSLHWEPITQLFVVYRACHCLVKIVYVMWNKANQNLLNHVYPKFYWLYSIASDITVICSSDKHDTQVVCCWRGNTMDGKGIKLVCCM